MSTVVDCGKNTLRQCLQARSQLEATIAGVTQAEVQLRDNSREVRMYSVALWVGAGVSPGGVITCGSQGTAAL